MELDGLPSTVMPSPAVTLTFDLLTRKPNQHVTMPRQVCDLILVKLA